MSDDELEAWAEDQLAQEAQDIAILHNEIAIEGQELAELERSAELTSSEIHFMDMVEWVKLLDPLTNLIDAWQVPTFRAHMAECRDANCVIGKEVGVDRETEENEGAEENVGWAERVLSLFSRYFQGEDIGGESDSDDETSSEEGNV